MLTQHDAMQLLPDLKAALSRADYESLEKDPELFKKLTCYACLQQVAKAHPEWNLNAAAQMLSMRPPVTNERMGYDMPTNAIHLDGGRLYDYRGVVRASIELWYLEPRGTAEDEYYDCTEPVVEVLSYFDPTDEHWTNPNDAKSDGGRNGWTEVYQTFTPEGCTKTC